MTVREFDISQVNVEQEFIMKKFASLVREVLTVVEAAIPPGQQYNSTKKLLQSAIYDSRNDFLSFFDSSVESGE